MREYIKLEECVRGGVYQIGSRNLSVGVFDGIDGFVGIRSKFNHEYLFTEYHCDTDGPFGTVYPKTLLEICPLDDLRETIGTVDASTRRPIKFDKPVSEGGKGWCFVDTGEPTNTPVMAISLSNKPLFQYLNNVLDNHPSEGMVM